MIRETDWSKKLHWTTTASEKILLGFIGTLTMIAAGLDIYRMTVVDMKIELGDLFLLFIYAEIVGRVGSLYSSYRIPATLPSIIAITALCRLIVLHSKEADPWMLFAEAGAIAILAGAAYMMSLKDKLSLDKELRRKRLDKAK